jgi:hypothetical protein
MIHDQSLVDQLSALATERFEGEVFRATGISADALAFSANGGRWAPPRATARTCRFFTPAGNEVAH